MPSLRDLMKRHREDLKGREDLRDTSALRGEEREKLIQQMRALCAATPPAISAK